MLTPYQFASNRPIDGVDLDGLEFFKKNNFSYRLDYRPVGNASGVMAGANNAAHNAMSFVWNGAIGAILEGGRNVNNYFAGGYKEPVGSNVVTTFNNTTHEMGQYYSNTPIKQIVKDFGEAATDLTNYEALPSLIIAHQLFSPPALTTTARVPLQEEIFTKSIGTRGAAETYAEMTSYKSYWNANKFIKANNKAFDLISTIEKKVVDVATTDKAGLQISSWERNKLTRLGSNKFRPQGYSSTLQLYVKEGKYTAEQLANYRKFLNDYIANEGLKNVSAEVSEIPKR